MIECNVLVNNRLGNLKKKRITKNALNNNSIYYALRNRKCTTPTEPKSSTKCNIKGMQYKKEKAIRLFFKDSKIREIHLKI